MPTFWDLVKDFFSIRTLKTSLREIIKEIRCKHDWKEINTTILRNNPPQKISFVTCSRCGKSKHYKRCIKS